MTEDDEVFEMMKNKLEDYYYTVSGDTMFYDFEEEMTAMVVNTLGMEKNEAYKFVCSWMDNRH